MDQLNPQITQRQRSLMGKLAQDYFVFVYRMAVHPGNGSLAEGAHALFTFGSELYERLSFIIATNLQFADWVQVFGNERLTAALLDRLTYHAHILELVGESHRFRQRMAGQ